MKINSLANRETPMPSLYPLKNKVVLSFKNKADEFLKAYTSNTPDAPLNAFLDRGGKIVVTFYQKRLNADETLIVIEKAFQERLMKHLKTYLEFSETKVSPQNWNLYYHPGEKYTAKDGEQVIWDGKGTMVLTKNTLPADLSDESILLFRLRHNLPVQGIDFDEEMLLCVGDESYVSYDKGCYLGQEIIARVHYKSKPPKKLVVRYEDECTPEQRLRMTSKAVDNTNGKIFAFVFVENKG